MTRLEYMGNWKWKDSVYHVILDHMKNYIRAAMEYGWMDGWVDG
jgi:hypothetical protein